MVTRTYQILAGKKYLKSVPVTEYSKFKERAKMFDLALIEVVEIYGLQQAIDHMREIRCQGANPLYFSYWHMVTLRIEETIVIDDQLKTRIIATYKPDPTYCN